MFDVAVDLRRSSPTFGRAVGVTLSADNKRMLWIPPGFAHGFLVVSDDAEFLYKTTDYWHPEHERTLLWNDPALGIDWPLAGEPIVAARTLPAMPLASAETYAVPMRILLTGASGQVGCELAQAVACAWRVVALDRAALDLAHADAIVAAMRAAKPDIVVNAAAYTAVDLAERERDLAFAVNARAPQVLAEEARRTGAVLIHYSTDYVFDGRATVALRRRRADRRRSTCTARASSKASARLRRRARARSSCARAGSTA